MTHIIMTTMTHQTAHAPNLITDTNNRTIHHAQHTTNNCFQIIDIPLPFSHRHSKVTF